MKNILDQNTLVEIFERLENLSEDSERRWGKMTVNQMVCHLRDQIGLALGEIKTAKHKVLFKPLIKSFVLLGLFVPKGKIKTFPEIDQALGNGSKPTTLKNDIELLKEKLKDFISKDESYPFAEHAAFGKLNKKQWGRLIYLHLDHHLKQFGV